MTRQSPPFNNTASLAERARQFDEDQRRLRQAPEPVSMRDIARADEVLGAQGRFAEQARVPTETEKQWGGE
jgi:hypothetical protein